MPITPGAERLLAVIELQNVIAAAAMSADEVMRVASERVRGMLEADGVMVALVEADDLVCRAVSGSTRSTLGMRLPQAWSLAGVCVTEKKPVRSDNAAADPRVDPEAREHTGAQSIACVPLVHGEFAVGVLEAVSGRLHAFTDEDVATLALVANVVAIAIHRAHTYPRPRYDSLHDPQTGLANRRAFDETIQVELGRNQRYGQTFSLAMFQLVGLESASDRLGQATADEILRDVAATLKQHTRVIDECFRLGMAELAIVMPGTSMEGARVLAERFRARVANGNLGKGVVTMRFGVVEAGAETGVELTSRAIDALKA
jgi:diguanylate cyclase (GGDEF)-like protein